MEVVSFLAPFLGLLFVCYLFGGRTIVKWVKLLSSNGWSSAALDLLVILFVSGCCCTIRLWYYLHLEFAQIHFSYLSIVGVFKTIYCWTRFPFVKVKMIISSNIKSVRKPGAYLNLRNLVRNHKLEVVFFSETLANKSRMDELRRKLKFPNYQYVPAEGRSGGLALLWSEGMDIVVLSSCMMQGHLKLIFKSLKHHGSSPRATKKSPSQVENQRGVSEILTHFDRSSYCTDR